MATDQLVNLLAGVTLIEMMVTLGLGVKASDVVAVGKEWGLLVRALLANYILAPLAALGLLLLFHASPLVAAGLLVAAVCPGAPYAPPFTGMAKGNVTVSVGLMVVLAGSSAIVAPLLLGLLLPIIARNAALNIDVVNIITTLLGAQLVPLCVGLALRRYRPAFAQRLKKPAGTLSVSLNLLLLTSIIVVQFRTLVDIPMRGYLGMLCLVLATVLAGRIVAMRRHEEIAKSMILTTSVRNVGVGLVIATGSFAGTAAVTSTTAYAIFQTVTIALIAWAWGHRTPSISLMERKAA